MTTCSFGGEAHGVSTSNAKQRYSSDATWIDGSLAKKVIHGRVMGECVKVARLNEGSFHGWLESGLATPKDLLTAERYDNSFQLLGMFQRRILIICCSSNFRTRSIDHEDRKYLVLYSIYKQTHF